MGASGEFLCSWVTQTIWELVLKCRPKAKLGLGFNFSFWPPPGCDWLLQVWGYPFPDSPLNSPVPLVTASELTSGLWTCGWLLYLCFQLISLPSSRSTCSTASSTSLVRVSQSQCGQTLILFSHSPDRLLFSSPLYQKMASLIFLVAQVETLEYSWYFCLISRI